MLFKRSDRDNVKEHINVVPVDKLDMMLVLVANVIVFLLR